MKLFLKCVLLVIAIGSSAVGMASADKLYLDDRSTPERLVQSYYNAINQQQYARAYGYFSVGFAPQDYQSWVSGYTGTQSVSIQLGGTQADPGAGQIYWALPVVISVLMTDGSSKIYAGCYSIHLTNPSMQTNLPFQSMSISGAKLRETNKPIQNVMPKSCED